MAASINDRGGRQQLLEGLWLIGIEPTQLNVDPGLDPNAFLDALRRNGVNDEFVRRAMAAADWRVTDEGPGALMYRIEDWLKVAGYRPDEVARFREMAVGQGINNKQGLMQVLTTQFNERTAGAVIHKVTGGKPPQGAVWNPFRTDVPPKEVDTRFGGGGVMAGSPGGQGPLTTEVGGQFGGLPMGPTPVQQKQQAAAAPPGPPTVSGATPGVTGAAGAGAGGTAPYTPPPIKPLTPEERRNGLLSRYGWAAALLDDPEVARIVNDVASGAISEADAERQWKNSNYYKTTTANERAWRIFEGTDPVDARVQMEAQVAAVTTKAQGLGFTIDPARARQIAEISKKHGWSDQQINAALASEIKWDPDGAKTGVLAQIKAAQQAQLVPLSDQAMTQWAQAITGGQRTLEQFQAYLKDQAKSLFPTIADSLETQTVRQYLDPYEQTIKKTLGDGAQVDWNDPKWFRFVNAVDDKGQRHVVSIADMQRTLVTDNQYGYDRTENGKQAKAGLARTILEDWGFVTGADRGGF